MKLFLILALVASALEISSSEPQVVAKVCRTFESIPRQPTFCSEIVDDGQNVQASVITQSRIGDITLSETPAVPIAEICSSQAIFEKCGDAVTVYSEEIKLCSSYEISSSGTVEASVSVHAATYVRTFMKSLDTGVKCSTTALLLRAGLSGAPQNVKVCKSNQMIPGNPSMCAEVEFDVDSVQTEVTATVNANKVVLASVPSIPIATACTGSIQNECGPANSYKGFNISLCNSFSLSAENSLVASLFLLGPFNITINLIDQMDTGAKCDGFQLEALISNPAAEACVSADYLPTSPKVCSDVNVENNEVQAVIAVESSHASAMVFSTPVVDLASACSGNVVQVCGEPFTFKELSFYLCNSYTRSVNGKLVATVYVQLPFGATHITIDNVETSVSCPAWW